MPSELRKPLIVISYAHADEPEHPAEGEIKWLSFVIGFLRPALKHGAVDIFLDRHMSGGADWEPEIEAKLHACDIFLLLVSRHSMASDYVVDKEMPIIRERQARGEDVHFYPLVLTPTPKIALNLVREKNLRPPDGKPFSDYSINERYRHMAEAANEILEIATEVVNKGEIRKIAGQPAASSQILGNIYLVKVARIEASLSAAFIDYGDSSHGFLRFHSINPDYYQLPARRRSLIIDTMNYDPDKIEANTSNVETTKQELLNNVRKDNEVLDFERFASPQLNHSYKIQDVIKKRQVLLAQVVRTPRDAGALVTTYLSVPGQYAVLTANDPRRAVSPKITNLTERARLKKAIVGLDVPEGMGVILRASSASQRESEIDRDFKGALRQWEAIRELTLMSSAPNLVYERASLPNDS